MIDDDTGSTWQPPAPGRFWRWGLRLSLAAALASSAYLAWTSLSGGTLVGCSALAQIDCRQVLSGRWSRWFSIPVSVPAVFIYAAMLLAAMRIGRAGASGAMRVAWLTLVFLAMLTAGAAVWFLGLMVFAEETFCPWCLTVHANALFSAGLIALAFRRRPRTSETLKALLGGPAAATSARGVPLVRIGFLAAAALGVLIAGQWLGPPPPTHRVQQLSDRARAELAGGNASADSGGHSTAAPQPSSAEPRPSYPVIPDTVPQPPGVVALSQSDRSEFPGGGTWNVRDNPCLGEANAPRVVVELIDYTCPNCREVCGHLKEAQQRYGHQFAIVVLPVPLCADCNAEVKATKREHVDACHYARLALAVWLADAGKYPAFHEWLFDPERPPPVAKAKERAAELVGRAALDAALRNPRVEQILKRNCRLFHLLESDVLPKLVIGNYVSSGRFQYRDAFFKMLEDYLGIQKAASGKLAEHNAR